MGDDSFCLKWNDHHASFFANAESLCASNALTDVLLSCGEREFAAHKLVLSVCSSYFANLFKRHAQRQTTPFHTAVVYLKDVDPRHMELILQYMYRGEINVQEDDLMDLLNTAKGLRVKGLTEAGGDTPKPASAVTPSTPSAAARGKKRPGNVININNPAIDVKRVKEEQASSSAFAGTSVNLEAEEDNDKAGTSADPDYDESYDDGNDDDYDADAATVS